MIKKGDNVVLKFSTWDGELSRYKGKAYIYESMENAAKYCYHHEELVEYTPVKRGHWIEDYVYDSDPHDRIRYKCSECDLILDGVAQCFTYCPNCGTKMEAGINE